MKQKMQTAKARSFALSSSPDDSEKCPSEIGMSAFIKGKLKLLKEALGAKDWTLVDKLAR